MFYKNISKPHFFVSEVFLLFICFVKISFAATLPQRIVSLSPPLTEAIYLLKEDSKLVGCTIYCVKPEEAKYKEKIGTIIDVDIEKLIKLKPDIVLTTSLTSGKTKDFLNKLNIKYVDFPAPQSFDELTEEFIKLGKLLGKEKTARIIAEKTRENVLNIRKKVRTLTKPKVFIQIGANPLFTANKTSFINDFIEYAGATNIAKDSVSG
ncbi:MAG: cobalamide ABC transporter substrate-binding protein, partial [Ignavibacteria bacterium]